ncbi:MAG TPA: ATP-binding protein [Bacillota bacterium]|nr:ATP-binding protein [Bacillota bacterium]
MAARIQTMLEDQNREKNKIRAILTGIGDGVVALDPEGRIMLVNQAAELLFGRREEEVLGQYSLSLVRNYRIDEVFTLVAETSAMTVEEVRTGGDPEVILRVHGAPILTEDRRLAGVVLVFRDISNIRQLEQIRTDFVANVSHEMKTPLTSIKGFVETLLDGALEDEQLCRRFLGIISQESERLTRLIEDLLSLAKIEAPKFEVARQATDFTLVVNKVLEIIKPIAHSKDISLHLQTAPDLPRVIIQEDLLGQILLNLIDNAVKYSPAHGRVEIYARLEDKVLVEVKDTGMGIPQDAQLRIFERFYRVDKARSREIGGTGLGLSIVKHILDRYSQTITVRSDLGKGSSFIFTLEPEPVRG